MGVRDEIEIGHTISFIADIRVSPLFKLVSAFTSFANNPQVFGIPSNMTAEHKRTSKMMEGWITGRDGVRSTAVYLQPNGVEAPRIVGRLSDKYLTHGLENIEETYHVVAQVRSILSLSDEVSILRVLRDAPPVPKEVETVTNAMANMQGAPAEALGIRFEDEDRIFTHPDVIVQPLAIFK